MCEDECRGVCSTPRVSIWLHFFAAQFPRMTRTHSQLLYRYLPHHVKYSTSLHVCLTYCIRTCKSTSMFLSSSSFFGSKTVFFSSSSPLNQTLEFIPCMSSPLSVPSLCALYERVCTFYVRFSVLFEILPMPLYFCVRM